MQFDAFYSDPHFAHANIIKYVNRPFDDVEHQIEELVYRYNQVVSHEDHVLWLGDCFFPKQWKTLDHLNGKKYLLRGNHDKRMTDTRLLRMGFEVVYSTHFAYWLEGHPVRFSHYPYEGYSDDLRYPDRRPPREPGVTLIHGHTHESIRFSHEKTVHVGVDGWDYRPATKDEVLDILKRR